MAELSRGRALVTNWHVFEPRSIQIGDTALAYERIYMKPWHPEMEDIVRFLQIVTDPSRTPAFVHCQHGADRTGLMCAVYRVAVCGWSKEEALKEMTEGGFGCHRVWGRLARFLRELDVGALQEELRRRGIPPRQEDVGLKPRREP